MLSKALARDGHRRASEAYARLNAIAAQLYGLTDDDVSDMSSARFR